MKKNHRHHLFFGGKKKTKPSLCFFSWLAFVALQLANTRSTENNEAKMKSQSLCNNYTINTRSILLHPQKQNIAHETPYTQLYAVNSEGVSNTTWS